MRKINDLSRYRKSVLGAFIFAAALALLPITVYGQCVGQWSAGGKWRISQGQKGDPIDLDVFQKGKAIGGTAFYDAKTGAWKSRKVIGAVNGSITGNDFIVEILWDGNLTGVYTAKVNASGNLESGVTYDKNKPSSRLTWRSAERMNCISPDPVEIPLPKKPKPLVTKPSGSAPAKTSPLAPPKPPFIIAGTPVTPTPYHPFGIVGLSWDAGPEQSGVAIWVSIDNGAEVPAFSNEFTPQHAIWKLPKAGSSLNLQRRHSYKFLLKDASGKVLSATAGFFIQ